MRAILQPQQLSWISKCLNMSFLKNCRVRIKILSQLHLNILLALYNHDSHFGFFYFPYISYISEILNLSFLLSHLLLEAIIKLLWPSWICQLSISTIVIADCWEPPVEPKGLSAFCMSQKERHLAPSLDMRKIYLVIIISCHCVQCIQLRLHDNSLHIAYNNWIYYLS